MKSDDRWFGLTENLDFLNEHGPIIEMRMFEEKKEITSCPHCGYDTYDLSLMKCELCECDEIFIECNRCHELYPESEITMVEDINGNEDLGAYTSEGNYCSRCIEDMSYDDYY